ncbi:MAG TPA: metalloregulator ArsR/SmtB family transcription factor [Acidimicrobiia bacterium]|jgi:ArsR family transcriptional regulator|nr:metalloregulator ArsR/SmtB family transcription factor [Acidimicrobiia bacterium]
MTVARIAEIGKALAHPARVRIVNLFRICHPHKVQDIVEECDLAQSTISEHLRILREADVVFASRDGPRTWYCLRRSVLREYVKAIEELQSTDELLLLA